MTWILNDGWITDSTWPFTIREYSRFGRLYNPETHDLVPKDSFLEKEVERLTGRLKALKQEKEDTLEAYEKKIKETEAEISGYRKRLKQ